MVVPVGGPAARASECHSAAAILTSIANIHRRVPHQIPNCRTKSDCIVESAYVRDDDYVLSRRRSSA